MNVDGFFYIYFVALIFIMHVLHYEKASLVQWSEFLPSKQEARVRFPDDAFLFFYQRYYILKRYVT